jgi:hypothetical protein
VGPSRRFGRSRLARCLGVAQGELFCGSLRLNFDNLEGRMGAMDNLHHRAQAN